MNEWCSSCVVIQGLTLMVEMGVWFPARSLHRVHVQGLVKSNDRIIRMLGLSAKLYYISSCYFFKKYDPGKRTIVVTECVLSDFWSRGVSAVHCDVNLAASLSDLIWESRQIWCVNDTTVDFELVKSKSHAACASPVSFMVWNPREALNAQRSWVRLSHLGLALAFFDLLRGLCSMQSYE